MIVIPKHIEDYMHQIEHFLVCSQSPKRDDFLDLLRYTIKSFKSYAGITYVTDNDFLNAFFVLIELEEFVDEMSEKIPSFKTSYHITNVEPELTCVLNSYSFDIGYENDVDAIIKFIQKPIKDFYVSNCDYLHFKLIKSEEEWNTLSKDALIETEINSQNLIAKAIFMINDPETIAVSETRLAFAKSTLREELISLNLEPDPELFEELFNFWFQIGIHGTFFIYLPKYVNEK